MRRHIVCAGVVACVILFASTAFAETHSEIQAVDESGIPTHPKVIRTGNPWSVDKLVVMEGIVTVAPYELVDTTYELLINFQGEDGDHAGTQIWTGSFFQDWPEPYDAYFGLVPGDRIRVTGYAAQFVGKVNINEQHSDDPAKDFVIELLGHPGMPVPEVVPDVTTAKTFDATRATGGEYYQNRWVRMNGLTITTPGTWMAGEEVTVTDGIDSMQMMLSAVGDFDSYTAPTGTFDVVALLDQEPRPMDFMASPMEFYRLWVTRVDHILAPGAPFLVKAVSRLTHGVAGDFDIDVSMPGAVETRVKGSLSSMLLVVTFDRAVVGADGLDVSDVIVSSGTINGVAANGSELSISIDGVTNAGIMTVDFPGIISVGNGAAVNQSLCFGVLRGDVSQDGIVNTTDYIYVRARMGMPVTDSIFRSDVWADGVINTTDYVAIRCMMGHQLGASCP